MGAPIKTPKINEACQHVNKLVYGVLILACVFNTPVKRRTTNASMFNEQSKIFLRLQIPFHHTNYHSLTEWSPQFILSKMDFCSAWRGGYCGGQVLGKIRRMIVKHVPTEIYLKELSIGESYRRTAGLGLITRAWRDEETLAGPLVLVLSSPRWHMEGPLSP